MAAPKRQKITEKQTSSDEKIQGLSLYFIQGKDFIFEGFDWLDFARGLDKLSDAEKLLKVKELSRKYRTPQVEIRTLKVGEDGETQVRHNDVRLVAEAPGRYKASIPDLYPDDGPDEFEVCGVTMVARSWTTALHNEWEAFMEDKNLKQLQKDINDLTNKINENIPSSEDIATSWLQLPGLEVSRQTLIDKEAAAFADLNTSDEEIARISARLKLTVERIDTIKTQQKKWSTDHDPFQQELNIHPEGKLLKEKIQTYENAYLEFVHRLATRYEKTTDTLEDWLEGSTKLDRANAGEVVSQGNAPHVSGEAAKPLTREDKQAKAYQTLN